jgi:uncharacterized repeat protein (TIGR01451 family)
VPASGTPAARKREAAMDGKRGVSIVWRRISTARRSLARITLFSLLLAASLAHAATVSNTAHLSYLNPGGGPVAQDSNTVEFQTAPGPSPGTVTLLRHAPTAGSSDHYQADGAACGDGAGGFGPVPPLNVIGGAPLDLSSPAPLLDTGSYHAGEPVFVIVTDANRNVDPLARDTIDLQLSTSSGDQEVLRLQETGPDTGMFAGGIQSLRIPPPQAAFDCRLSLAEDTTLRTDYVDATDASDQSSDQALVDPFGYAFDSATGARIDGAVVTIIDLNTGAPATVFGDDGTSVFPPTVTTGASATDSGGTTYVFPPGGYRFPVVPSGTYRFEITPPPSHLAPSTVPASVLANNPNTSGYAVGVGSFEDAFLLSPGPTLRIDLPLDPLAAGDFVLEKQASREEVSAGDFVQYQLELRNASPAAATGVRLEDVLPFGFRYRDGSLRLDGVRAPDPAISGDGRTLDISRAPDGSPLSLAASTQLLVTYVVEVTAGAEPGDAINRAIGRADGDRATNRATALVRVKEPFFGSCAVLVGRVVDGECTTPQEELGGVANVRLLLDDGTYTNTDKNGQFHFEKVCDGTHVVQLDLESLPPDTEVIPCIQNTRFAGRSFSQFVDVQGGTLWRTDFYVRKKPGTSPTAPEAAAQPAPAPAPPREDELTARRRAIPDDATASGGKTDWLVEATRAPGPGWLFPPEGHNPRAPSLRVAIRHEPSQHVELSIAGVPVDALTFDGAKPSADGKIAVSVWRGIPLVEGNNELTASIVDASGQTVQTLARTVHYSNSPARAELVPEQSVLVADGNVRPVIAVRFLDRDGRPVRSGVTGPFTIGPPYVLQQMVDLQQKRQLAGLDRFTPTYRVEGEDGIAYVELQPTTESGQVLLDFAFSSEHELERNVRRQQLQAWLEAEQRNWVLVGFAEGSFGYQTLSGNMEGLEEAGHDEDGLVTDGKTSFYTKGRVLGKWLLTLAYHSDDREQEPLRDRESLQRVIDPDEFYTIYGDGSEQRYDAATQHHLYVKLERPQFYALFGDYETGLTQTELARYSRSLSGFKSEYGGKHLSYKAFAANTSQRFVRDEIQGDGTSGLYRLSGQHIVINSEKIAIETRDRFHSQDIVQSRVLLRHIDYDIDYTNGTLFFREPIFSRDTELNPVFIVADYEVQNGGDEDLNAGGRAATQLLDGKVEAGVSYIRDAESTGETDLGGVDMKVKLAPGTELRLEAAGSDGDQSGESLEGAAYLAELEHFGKRFDSLVYVRRQAPEFGVGQQFSAESGQEKQGLLGRVPIGEKTAVSGEAYRQENLTSDVERLAGVMRLERKIEKGNVFGGVQYARDEDSAGDEFESQQIVLGANRKFLADKLDLLGQSDVSIGGKDDSIDFPSRYLAQAGYDVTKSVKLIAAEEITNGGAFDTQTTRVGTIVNPWRGAKLSSTLNQDLGEYGPRTFGLLGLTQSVLVGKNWGVDVGVDQSTTFAGPRGGKEPPRTSTSYPVAAGGGVTSTGTPGVFGLSTEDFTAVSAGATYRADLWSLNGRGEVRDGETDDRWGVTANFLREARAGVAFASSARVFAAERRSGTQGLFGSVDLSWAYRPLGSRWSLLDRLEFRLDQLDDGTGVPGSGLFGANSLTTTGDAVSRAVVNNFNLNRVSRAWTAKDRKGNLFDLNQRNQWSFYYGSKYAFDEYDGETYTGYTDLIGAEWRFDLKTWLDVGAQASMLHSWNAENYQFSAGPSVGFSPIENSWISIGYNVIGFRDPDFDAARYTGQGVIVKMRIKFDQLTRWPGHDKDDPRAVDALAWPGRAEGEPR